MIVALHFVDGACTGLAFPADHPARRTFTVAELAAEGHLSAMDRMVLAQLAARVENIAVKIAGEPQ